MCTEKTYTTDAELTDDELIGILGQLLDDQEPDTEMSEKVRKGIYDVYSALVARVNN